MCLFYEVLTFHSSRVVGNWVCNYLLSGEVLLRTQSYRKKCRKVIKVDAITITYELHLWIPEVIRTPTY